MNKAPAAKTKPAEKSAAFGREQVHRLFGRMTKALNLGPPVSW